MLTSSAIYALLLATSAFGTASASENYEFNEEGKLGVGSSFQNGSAVCTLNGVVYPLKDGYIVKSSSLTGKLSCIIEGKTAFEGGFDRGRILSIFLYTSDFKPELRFEAKSSGGYQLTQYHASGKTPASRISYDSEKRESGVSQYFYENGKVQNQFTFAAGKKHGRSDYYDEAGNSLKIDWFQNDELLVSYGLLPKSQLKSAIECKTASQKKIEFPEPKQLCGHGKIASHEIYDATTQKLRERNRFENGVAVWQEAFDSHGKLKERVETYLSRGFQITTRIDDSGSPKQSDAFPVELREGEIHARGRRIYRVSFEDGKPSRITCDGEVAHRMSPDYCGFDGTFKTPLYVRDPNTKKIKLSKTVVMKNGKEVKSGN